MKSTLRVAPGPGTNPLMIPARAVGVRRDERRQPQDPVPNLHRVTVTEAERLQIGGRRYFDHSRIAAGIDLYAGSQKLGPVIKANHAPLSAGDKPAAGENSSRRVDDKSAPEDMFSGGIGAMFGRDTDGLDRNNAGECLPGKIAKRHRQVAKGPLGKRHLQDPPAQPDCPQR